MKRAVSLLTAVLILVAGSRPVQASNPEITAQVFGIELCPQFICGAAIFSGVLAGQVDGNPPAFGTFTVATTHEALPQVAGAQSDLTGGVFEIRVGFRRFRGVVSSGTLTKNLNNSFTVYAVLTITRGGSGDMNFLGTLDHTVFPPTISGFIFQ
jgi:hypothetical protein